MQRGTSDDLLDELLEEVEKESGTGDHGGIGTGAGAEAEAGEDGELGALPD